MTIDASGRAVALKTGSATITAQNLAGTVASTCDVVVTAPQAVTGVSFGQTQINIGLDNVLLLNYDVYPENAGDKGVTFTSGNPAVVTVNENGLLTAKGVGTANITIKTTDGNKQAICNVTVEADDFQIIAENCTITKDSNVYQVSVTLRRATSTPTAANGFVRLEKRSERRLSGMGLHRVCMLDKE